MAYDSTIRTVREVLCTTLTAVDRWFERSTSLRSFKPASGGWSVDEVLEHITLTNRFLLLTLGKWVRIAEQRYLRGIQVHQGESDLERLIVIGQRGSFGWTRPDHMEPSGIPSDEVRATLHRQLGECLIHLDRLRDGIGSLCRITMTVNDLGKIDLYQWLFFLAMHAQRHLQQMDSLEQEFTSATCSV